jgi:HEAT repeat protein
LSTLEQINTWNRQNLNYVTKKQIIKSLEAQRDKEACYSLIEFLYDEHKPIQELAMDTLIRIGTKEVMEGLLPLLQQNDARLRSMAMEVLREIAYDHITLLIPFLDDSHESMRTAIADLLGLVENPGAVEPLIASLKDSSPQVRSSALASLGRLADERAVLAIEKLLQTEKESWVVFSCVKSLERIGGKSTIRILLELLNKDDEFILAAAIESLGEIGSIEIIPSILDTICRLCGSHPSGSHLSDSNLSGSNLSSSYLAGSNLAGSNLAGSIIERMNRALISILHRDGAGNLSKLTAQLSKRSRDNLVSFFNLCTASNIDIRARVHAIELLGELKAQESLDALTSVVQDAPPMLQSAAARTLGNIGGDTARRLLLQLAASPDSTTRTAAQESRRKLA